MVIQTTFPEEISEKREIRENIDLFLKNISKELRKEILTLYKLGLEDYEIGYLLALKIKKENKVE